MDTTFAHAVAKIVEMPTDAQRMIGKALLESAIEPRLPVIEFCDD